MSKYVSGNILRRVSVGISKFCQVCQSKYVTSIQVYLPVDTFKYVPRVGLWHTRLWHSDTDTWCRSHDSQMSRIRIAPLTPRIRHTTGLWRIRHMTCLRHDQSAHQVTIKYSTDVCSWFSVVSYPLGYEECQIWDVTPHVSACCVSTKRYYTKRQEYEKWHTWNLTPNVRELSYYDV